MLGYTSISMLPSLQILIPYYSTLHVFLVVCTWREESVVYKSVPLIHPTILELDLYRFVAILSQMTLSTLIRGL